MVDANEMVGILGEALRQNVGVKAVTSDGTTIQFDREQVRTEYAFWVRQVVKCGKRRTLGKTIDISNAW